MFWQSADKIGRVCAPVLIHFLAANIISLLGLHLHVDAAFLTTITAVLLLPLFAWMYRNDRCAAPAAKRPMRTADILLTALFGVLANLILSVCVSRLLFFFKVPNAAQEALLESNFAVQLAGLGAAVPVMEELLFRGLVYNRLKGYTKRAWSAALLSSAIFAVYHGNLAQMLFAFPMALALAAVYQRWGTLKAPIIFHMAVNISTVLLAANI